MTVLTGELLARLTSSPSGMTVLTGEPDSPPALLV